MTAPQTVADVQSALAKYDGIVSTCPANKTFLGERKCPTCGATSNDGCFMENRAAYKFIAETRAALRAAATSARQGETK